jgi:tRNA dimethylallyltransferase
LKSADPENRLIVVGGATASGKTALAIELAAHFKTEVLSADSRQFYKELNIGVARPSEVELNSVKHNFIGTHSIEDPISAGQFAQLASVKLMELFTHHKYVVIVGGSGLYMQALVSGFHGDDSGGSQRREVQNIYAETGLIGLQEMLRDLDIEHFNKIDKSNPQRLMRAIERVRGTGLSHSAIRKENLSLPDYKIIEIGIDLPREQLYDRINVRVDQMMKDGLLEEVRLLIPMQNEYVLNAVGYKELFKYLKGNTTIEKAVEQIKQNTRRYAKRQLTWFRNKTDTRWFKPEEFKNIATFIDL